LFGNIECKKKKMKVGRNIIRFFFQLLKNPYKIKRLTGGINIPETNNKYVYHEFVM
jgi:hypothetical protein